MPEQERPTRGAPPLGTENAAMPEDEGVSEIGETEAMERSIAIEQRNDPESGGIKEQREYLRWERKVDEEEVEEERRG